MERRVDTGGSQLVVDSTVGRAWSSHFQLTIINQVHSGFKAKYSGMNSLADTVEPSATSITTTLFLGRRLWKNTTLFLNPELSGGAGLSYAVGVAGALNGETYRIGNPSPSISVARVYLQQVIPLGGSGFDDVADAANQIEGKIPSRRLTITAGKFSMADFYDKNSFSHDPRSQFLDWALMSDGAWDYPANIKGYTEGLMLEWAVPGWSFRLSSVAEPRVANHSAMEYVIGKSSSETAELERDYNLGKQPGVVRLLFSNTDSRAPSYKAGLEAIADQNTTLLKIISGNAENPHFGGHKRTIGLSAEQGITDNISVFARAGWNDGKYATWAFTEIDQTVSGGFSFKGNRWGRIGDVAGVAGVINGISAGHRAFLKAGGYGFIIGDGYLNYGYEDILETYYNAALFTNVWITADYEFVNHPAYNKDRGPVHVFALRGHFEF
ncbi:MAG TPA: carbohydrate porin [Puia sp.]|nr:carbohydrate porin [Puia sp.]